MRRFAFIITIMGLSLLIFLLLFTTPTTISSNQQLENLQENQKILTTGKVIKEMPYYNDKFLTLDNNIELICESCPSFLNKNITAIGIVETYTGKPKIKILKITKQ